MITLDVEPLLYHLLCKPEFSEQGVTYPTLRKMRTAIEQELENQEITQAVYIDITHNSLIHMMGQLPEYFFHEYPNDVPTFKRAIDSDKNYTDPDKQLQFESHKVPKEISDLVLKVISEL